MILRRKERERERERKKELPGIQFPTVNQVGTTDGEIYN
jgi:hypothetical protein